VVVRVSKVTVVEEPDIANVQDLIVCTSEELGEVLAWLK
jgi:hypothetical protein